MSIITVYQVDATPKGNGDTDNLMQQLGNAPQTVLETGIYIGSLFDGTFDQPTAGFFRFEIDIPAGATIIGILFKGFSTGSALGGPINFNGGFLKQQGVANAWEDADGCAAWTIDNEIPFGEANTFVGVVEFPAVWWGNAPAFADKSMSVVTTTFAEWSFGEGTLNNGTAADVTGLIAQLQSYLDDPGNKATRGATKAGAIPAMLHIYRDYAGDRNEYQRIFTANYSNANQHPTLTIEYTTGTVPVMGILEPSSPITVDQGAPIFFRATSIDAEDGDISSAITWDSSIDGVGIFTGEAFSTSTLSVGVHTITANSLDSDSNLITDTVQVTVNAVAASEGVAELLVEEAGSAILVVEAEASAELVVEESATSDLQVESAADAELVVEDEGGE